MTDCVRIDSNHLAAEIWSGKAKPDLVDENGPLYPAVFIAELIEVDSGTVELGDIWDGAAFQRPLKPSNPKVDGAIFLERVSDGEYTAIMAAAQGNVKLARWIDQLRVLGFVDVTSEAAKAAQAALVAAGLLTQQRAAAIFAPTIA